MKSRWPASSPAGSALPDIAKPRRAGARARTTAAAPASIEDVIDIDREDAHERERNDRSTLRLMLSQPPLWLILIAFVCAHRAARVHSRARPLPRRDAGSASAPRSSRSASAARSSAGPTSSGTRWKVGWLPLGGYVRFIGDMNPASAPGDRRRADAGGASRAQLPPQAGVAAIPDRAGRTGGQFPARDPDLRGFLRRLRSAAHAQHSRH